MRNILYLLIALLVIVIGIAWMVFFRTPPDSSIDADNTSPTLFDENTYPSKPQNSNSTVPKEGQTSISLADGTKIVIPDLTKTPQPVGRVPQEEGYVLTSASEVGYEIVYFASVPDDPYVLISLLKEPLGEVRRDAEAKLRQLTGLSDSTLCELRDAQVWTRPEVNPFYAKQNLGLSFCPGAVLLP